MTARRLFGIQLVVLVVVMFVYGMLGLGGFIYETNLIEQCKRTYDVHYCTIEAKPAMRTK